MFGQRQVPPMLAALMAQMKMPQQGPGTGMGAPPAQAQPPHVGMMPQGQPQGGGGPAGLLNQQNPMQMAQMMEMIKRRQAMGGAGGATPQVPNPMGGTPPTPGFDASQMPQFMGGIQPDMSKFQLPPEFLSFMNGGGM